MPDRLPTLAEARRSHGLSQRQVAHGLGVHQRTISRLEHGEIEGITADFIDRYTAQLENLSRRPGARGRRTEPHSVDYEAPRKPPGDPARPLATFGDPPWSAHP